MRVDGRAVEEKRMDEIPEYDLVATAETIAKIQRGLYTTTKGQISSSPKDVVALVKALAAQKNLSLSIAAQAIVTNAQDLVQNISELEQCLETSPYEKPSWHVHPGNFWGALADAYKDALSQHKENQNEEKQMDLDILLQDPDEDIETGLSLGFVMPTMPVTFV